MVADEMFDILSKTHLSTGHGGRDVMRKALEKYANFTYEIISLYVNLCEDCKLKSKKARKGLVVQPNASNDHNSRCQVDLIDYQSSPDGDYKFIMNYQDHLTKFVDLRGLKSKEAAEVANNLSDI